MTNERGTAVPGARVCADGSAETLPRSVMREPRCTSTDARGVYVIADLYAANYVVSSMARPYRPASFPADGDDSEHLELNAGEIKNGVDLVMLHGGVEVRGVISDLTGGPIAHARARAAFAGSAIETDEQGRFSLWVAPGAVDVSASADGYADGHERGTAPGTFDVTLVPESSISGTVVDATTNAPVAGVAIDVSANLRTDWFGSPGDISGEHGRFRIDGLTPGRYLVIAREQGMFGISEGTILVGLAQHVDGIVVTLTQAARVEGKVVVAGGLKRPCNEPGLWLTRKGQRDSLAGRGEPDGTVRVDSVLPGTYTVQVGCHGFVPLAAYPALEVTDKNVSGLRWEVAEGSTIRGRVLSATGEPVVGAKVSSYGEDSDVSKEDGSYLLRGVSAGKHTVFVSSPVGIAPMRGYEVDVTERGVVERDLVLEESGAIKGVVVDTDGRPVSNADVSVLRGGGWDAGALLPHTRDDGTFEVDKLTAGDYRLSVAVNGTDLRLQGVKRDVPQETLVKVRALQTAMTRIVVENLTGSISGTVIDAAGDAVTDAYIVAARESSDSKASVEATRWIEYDRPVITGLDGSFSLTKLSFGTYTIRAFRIGGGEAFAKHVAIGGSPTLQIKASGSIDGTVRMSAGAPPEFFVNVTDPTTKLTRVEQFFRTNGHYSVRDLPAGNYVITCYVGQHRAQTSTTLADGEHKRSVDVDFNGGISVIGRIVDLATKQPVAGIAMNADLGDEGYSPYLDYEHETEVVTDTAGHFKIANVPVGWVRITGSSTGPYGDIGLVRVIEGTANIDLGDVGIVKRRVERNGPIGKLGINWAEFPEATPSDQRSFKVTAIDPASPAAKTKLQIGDVVTTIDGIDVLGANRSAGWNLLDVPPGTAVRLGLQRGLVVTVVAAAP